MPSITHFMTNLGFTKGAGPNFYLPNPHPHIHVGVANADLDVANLVAIRDQIQFMALSYGGYPGSPPNVQLYTRNPPNQALENRMYDLNRKQAFEESLAANVGVADAIDMQTSLNLLTGIGIDV